MEISVFGLGYVGAVTAGCLSKQGHSIVGVDVLDKKVKSFNDGHSPIVEPELDELLRTAKAQGRLRATTEVQDAVTATEISIVCVGTPSLENGRLDLRYVRAVAAQLAEAILEKGRGHTVILRSTMLPGSSRSLAEEILNEPLEKGLLQIFYCPEFLREGTAVADFEDPSLSVVGTGDGKQSALPEIENLLGEGAEILTWEGAEMIKYACNYFHALKVSFANEIGRFGKLAGVDAARVMEVVCADTRLNISAYYMRPGNPFGGSCLPKDVSALASFARQEGVQAPVLESVLPSNNAHLDALLKLIASASRRSVAILGLAFKSDTDDLRGSPMVAVAESLLGRGYSLKIFDPNLNLAQLIGSNERHIERTMPHLAELMAPTLEETLEEAELIIAAQKCVSLEELRQSVTPDQHIIDVNGWRELSELPSSYEGFCW